MKKTLLSIVKGILSELDSEDVGSISDTVEALQIAQVVESTFNDIIATRNVPEHESLLRLVSLSDNNYPTHFVLQDNQGKLKSVWYDASSDGSYQYKEIKYLNPSSFLSLIDKRQSEYTLVNDKTANTKLRIGNTQHPTYYTSFDDEHIVFDSHDASIDTVLREEKTRALGVTYPTFSISDTYVPDLDPDMFPYLIQEAKSRCFSIFKGAIDQKIEQSARRQKIHVQNDKRRVGFNNKLRNYGRR